MESKSAPQSPFRWYDPILLRVVPPLVALLFRLLMFSCRVVKVEGIEREREARAQGKGNIIYCTWHQRISFMTYYRRSRNVIVMISQSRDGEYVARMVEWIGIRSIRGSTTLGGTTALREIIKKIREGKDGGMLADGPLGPARVAKIGAVIMARNAKVPLVPVLWGADRCWSFNSWDRFLIPKPFARVVVYFGDPIWVPSTVKGKELEAYRRVLEDSMNQWTSWCDRQLGQERPWRKVTENGMPEIGPLPTSPPS
jgi:lysophospholipid acyltransferase (LPLAT)-like uncharacterized protein